MKIIPTLTNYFLLAIGCAAALNAEMPLPLAEALSKAGANDGRWAYTETKTVRVRGKTTSVVQVRYDPSKPYGEQHTPLSIDGAPPSKRALKKYRDLGEQEAATRQKQYEQQIKANEAAAQQNQPVVRTESYVWVYFLKFGENVGVYDFRKASLVEENDLSITYTIPVASMGGSSIPFEKIQFLVRVNKKLHVTENISLNGPIPYRIKLIAKVKTVETSADYAAVDAEYPPQASTTNTHINGTVLGAKYDVYEQTKRTDFKHVKPYDERFSVNAGLLQIFGF